jgi:integrase
MEAPTVEQNRWQRFISTFSSKATVATYKGSTRKFLRQVYGDSFTNLEEAVERYFSEDRDYKEDVRSFFVSIKDHPPKSVWTWLSSVRTLLIENGVDIELRFWRGLRRRTKGTRTATEDKVPTNKELRQILAHMRAKGKAFFLMLASSGMRIGEAIQLQLDDIELTEDPDKKPTTIHIQGEYTKSRNKRTAFMSREATEAMNEWLNIREASLRTAIARSRGRKNKDDPRIFPYDIVNMYAVWNGALDKAKLNGVDKTTNRRKMHPHVLRKFFRGQMATAIPVDVVEALMGHEGYLTTVYRKYPDPEKTLAEFYLQAEHTILITTETGDVTKLKKEMEETKKKAEDRAETLQDIVNGLNAKNLKLDADVKKLSSEVEKLAANWKYANQLVDSAWDELDDKKDFITKLLAIISRDYREKEELKARVEKLEKKQKKK